VADVEVRTEKRRTNDLILIPNRHLNFPRYRCITRLMEKSRYYILEHFVRVAVESKDILELTIDDFYSIVSDEMLNVKVEKI
jgi:BTB And C-terminal Kelch